MTFKEYILQEEKKYSKAKAGYVAHPVDGEVCKHCTMWREPNRCTAVNGYIDPEGWCKWYKRSHKEGLTEKSIHDPVRPGILKRQIKGKVTCAKARALKAHQKNKGNATAKASNRFLNYHCQ
jgi:hypothetical protein